MASLRVPTDLDRTTGAALARLARRWDLGDLLEARALSEGTMNRNYRIETSTGPWFAKQYLDAGPRQVGIQHRATMALALRGLPVPVPVAMPGSGGRTFVRSQGRPATIYPWVGGQHRDGLSLPLDDCWQLGVLLGQLHHELGAVQQPVQQTFLAPVPDADETLSAVDSLLALIESKTTRDDFDELVLEQLIERRQLLMRLRYRRPRPTAVMTIGWTHGDFHGLNLLYKDDGRDVVAILDWDRLGVQPFAHELTRAATLLFGHGDDRGLDLTRVARFVDGYRQVVPLDWQEVTATAHRLWWIRLNDMWMLQRHYKRGDTTCDHLFPSATSLVTWWTDQYDEVEAAFTSGS